MGGIPLAENKCYLFFTGYNSVAAASDILDRYNIDNRIVKAPVDMRSGCSFAVYIDKADVQMCEMIFGRENMKPVCKQT